MSRDNAAPRRKARIIALFAMLLAVVGGLALFDTANDETETPTDVTDLLPPSRPAAVDSRLMHIGCSTSAAVQR
jgi:hypothetical protein